MPERCRSCKAPIRWALIASTGGLMPFDFEPAPAGTWRLEATGPEPAADAVPRAMFVKAEHRDGYAALYESHFATCPFAEQHRKPRGGRTDV